MDTDEIIYECSEAWFPLIDEAIARLRDADPDIIIDQVKEKFGGLRIYFTQSDYADDLLYKRLSKIVNEAEKTASDTCENCGSTPAHIYAPRGWYRTLCDEHAPE